jgi:hypothetical protein
MKMKERESKTEEIEEQPSHLMENRDGPVLVCSNFQERKVFNDGNKRERNAEVGASSP